MSLPRGAFCWAPSPMVSLVLWTARSEVLGPLTSTSEMSALRLQPPGLPPSASWRLTPRASSLGPEAKIGRGGPGGGGSRQGPNFHPLRPGPLSVAHGLLLMSEKMCGSPISQQMSRFLMTKPCLVSTALAMVNG